MASSRINNPKYLRFFAQLNSQTVCAICGVTGTWGGTTAYSVGPYNGHTVANNNSAGYISYGALTTTRFTGKCTLSFWGITSSVGGATRRMVCQGTAVDPRTMMYLTNTGVAVFRLNDGTAGAAPTSGAVTYTDGMPHHYVGTYDGATAYLYVDGEIAGSAAAVIAPYQPTGNFEIGSYNGGTEIWNGQSWCVRYYTIALTGDEVKELLNYERRI